MTTFVGAERLYTHKAMQRRTSIDQALTLPSDPAVWHAQVENLLNRSSGREIPEMDVLAYHSAVSPEARDKNFKVRPVTGQGLGCMRKGGKSREVKADGGGERGLGREGGKGGRDTRTHRPAGVHTRPHAPAYAHYASRPLPALGNSGRGSKGGDQGGKERERGGGEGGPSTG
jgi:hypothetical protein